MITQKIHELHPEAAAEGRRTTTCGRRIEATTSIGVGEAVTCQSCLTRGRRWRGNVVPLGRPGPAAAVHEEEGPQGFAGASEELRRLADEARDLGSRQLADRLLDLAGDLEVRGEPRRPPVRVVEVSGVAVRVEGLPRELRLEDARRLYLVLAAGCVDFDPARVFSWS